MYKICYLQILVIFVTLIACASCRVNSAVNGSEGMIQTPERVRILQRDALNGDVGASSTLYLHYMQINEPQEALRWEKVAADHGDCHAMVTIAEWYLYIDEYKDANIWLENIKAHRCDEFDGVEQEYKQYYRIHRSK